MEPRQREVKSFSVHTFTGHQSCCDTSAHNYGGVLLCRVYKLANTAKRLNTVEHSPLFLLNVGCGLCFVLTSYYMKCKQLEATGRIDRVNSCFH